MRIVYVTEKISGIGGMERILIEKMNYLAEHTFHEIILITMWHDDNDPAYPITSSILRVNLNVPYAKGGITYPLALMRFNRIIKELSPSITILTWVGGAMLGAFGNLEGRTIYELHRPATMMKHQWLQKLMMKRVDAVVTLTHSDAEYYRKAKEVRVIPNFCSLSPECETNYSNRKVISLGRDIGAKDFPRLKRLWNSIIGIHPDWNLDIHHNTKDVTKAYLSGSIYAMTSRFEGFGIVLLEAMTCGLPVVAFDCPNGPRDIIEDGTTGFLIPYNRDDLFIERLTYLIEHPEIREKMGRAAKESVRRFSKPQIMSQWLKLFTKLKE